MTDTNKVKKLAADKVALLGLFVAALLTARLVVALKSALVLSEPVPLSRTGLSVSVPTGNGWQSQRQWRRQANGFTLRSDFALVSSKPTARVVCRYLLAAEKTTPLMRFEQEFEVRGVVVRTDLIHTDTLIVGWTHVTGEEMPPTMYMGTAELPDNRQLDIEVYEITGDSGFAEQVFRAVVGSLNFKDNRLLTAVSGRAGLDRELL
ncbi:MAG: hypothetical protein CEE38_10430 [Planctomycetes bacterium B3_Pla]|nr:MAG: hypothetical protein CEE38_10430 [Planctomycetes bacterium B3_Pla]